MYKCLKCKKDEAINGDVLLHICSSCGHKFIDGSWIKIEEDNLKSISSKKIVDEDLNNKDQSIWLKFIKLILVLVLVPLISVLLALLCYSFYQNYPIITKWVRWFIFFSFIAIGEKFKGGYKVMAWVIGILFMALFSGMIS